MLYEDFKRNAQFVNARLTTLHLFSSNNSKNTKWRHNWLTGTDHWDSKLSTNIQYEKNNHSADLIFQKTCKEVNKKQYFWHILDIQKQIIDNSWSYLHSLFLPDSNKCFFICLVPCIRICFYYFLILCSYFYFFFLLFSPWDTFYNLQCLIRFH